MSNIIFDNFLSDNWLDVLGRESSIQSLTKPITFINNEINLNKKIFPEINKIFEAFRCCSFKSTNVVIFGQDPYFQPGLANGLAFSVNDGAKIPASLKNIYKEIYNDIGIPSQTNGCLKKWASQGVLLLNSSLTVEESKPGSHSNIGWEKFIDNVVECLNKKENIVFMLWGNNAKIYRHKINKNNNLILTSSHPSPLSSHRGFFGCKHFSKCNDYLLKNNLVPIKW